MIKTSVVAAVAMLGVLCATPSYAACIAGPYVNVAPVTYSDTLTAAQNASLYAESSMYSLSGVYRLIFQKDGNLVLYKNGSQVIWATNIQNCIPTPNVTVRTRFQSDGNLVVYYALNNNITQEFSVWDTNTQGHPNARMVLQNDGNLVIRDANDSVLWAVRR